MDKTSDLLAQMTLEEKASLCSGRNFWYLQGIERLGIPSILVADGPHGLRRQRGDGDHVGLHDSDPATCFPTASALAASWNLDLLYRVGEALADECHDAGVGVLLGPGANIKRSPLCGRNFEYFSEDPYLSGKLAASKIRGLQSRGVGASLKHYCANNQEYRRMTIDVVVDERALREIYLAGFEIAVTESQPWTVMCAYNRINGTYASEHPALMSAILKQEWGHEGLVITDWGATSDRVAGLEAGVELEMPGTFSGNDDAIVAAVRGGRIAEAALDHAAARILQLIDKAATLAQPAEMFDAAAHHALARQAAEEGTVLLKNDGALLPLVDGRRIALLGRFAREPRYQGAGSSLVNPSQLDDLYSTLCERLGEGSISYAPGYETSGEHAGDAVIAGALECCAGADAVVICVGLTDSYEIEGLDRTHLDLPPGHRALIEAVAAVHQRVVVLLSNGSPVVMPWLDSVAAVVECYLGGQAAAGAVADILYGEVNPSGKLAESFPLRLEDTPCHDCFPGGPATVEYRESLYVGYRYYDSVGQPVLFPFGYGLSYTSFVYSDLRLSHERMRETDELVVSVDVTNSGAVAGREIVQVYVRPLEAVAYRPEKELKGFDKIGLEPGETSTVSVILGRRAFACFEPGCGSWVVEPGAFEILIGASSRDIRQRATVVVTAPLRAAIAATPAAYGHPGRGQRFSRADFLALLGRALPPNERDARGHYSIDTPLEDLAASRTGRLLNRLLQHQIDRQLAGQEGTATALLMRAILREAPLRWLLMARHPRLTNGTLAALVVLLNGGLSAGCARLFRWRPARREADGKSR